MFLQILWLQLTRTLLICLIGGWLTHFLYRETLYGSVPLPLQAPLWGTLLKTLASLSLQHVNIPYFSMCCASPPSLLGLGFSLQRGPELWQAHWPLLLVSSPTLFLHQPVTWNQHMQSCSCGDGVGKRWTKSQYLVLSSSELVTHMQDSNCKREKRIR